MKIIGTGPLSRTSQTKKSKSGDASRSSFADALGIGQSDDVEGPKSARATSSVDSLFHLQEVPDSTTGRSRGLKSGKDMLDALEDIRRGLLLGSIPVSNLRALARMVKNRDHSFSDPRLADILDEIELRARVELAKLGLDS